MAIPIRMPMPGQMTEECTVLQWYKAEGDTISKGDPLFEIETDKSNMEIEAFDEGTLLRIDAPEGATVPVESIVAWIGQPGDELPEPAAAGGARGPGARLAAARQPARACGLCPSWLAAGRSPSPSQARGISQSAGGIARPAASSRSARAPAASLPSSGSTRGR